MNMYVCTHMHAYYLYDIVNMYVCMYTYACILLIRHCEHVCMYTYACLLLIRHCEHVCMYIRAYIHTFVCPISIRVYMPKHVNIVHTVCIYVCVHVHFLLGYDV